MLKEHQEETNKNPKAVNPNWNKSQTIYVEAVKVRREEKRIGKGKDKKEYRRLSCLVTRFRVEHRAKLSLDLTKSLCLKAQQHLT